MNIVLDDNYLIVYGHLSQLIWLSAVDINTVYTNAERFIVYMVKILNKLTIFFLA